MTRHYGLRPRGLQPWDRLPDYHVPAISKEPAWLAYAVMFFAALGLFGSAFIIFLYATGGVG